MSELPEKKAVGFYLTVIVKWIWALVRKWTWYILLLTLSSFYVWKNRFYISDLSSLSLENVVFLIWIVLLLFPLFSEMEFMGVKIKRAIEQANAEVKESIQELRLQMIDLKVSNNLSVQIGNNVMPSQTEIDKLQRVLPDNSKIEVENTPDNTPTYLFKVRYELEKQLSELYFYIAPFEYSWIPMSKMVKDLFGKEIIDGITCDLLLQIIRIANNGIHGKQVAKEYIDFVQRSLPTVKHELSAAQGRLLEERFRNI